ncbi:MAG: hypothetical protein KBB83_06515 [Alphaproteobacteria bacterium]|nr:hypothetical protein [Alphaproteobacteria bacterium]
MKTYKKLSIILLVPVLLAGCEGTGSIFKDSPPRPWTPWEPKVETTTRQHDFVFKAGQTSLTKAQMRELQNIAASTDGSAKINARLLTHSTMDQITREPLKSRVNHLTRALIKQGVSRGYIDVVSQASTTAQSGSVITVMIDQSKVLPIKCDGWNYDVGNMSWPEGEPDFGCATASNLSQMVANPRDLEQGREMDASDSIRTDVFTGFYRDNKITKLLKNDTSKK